MPFDKYYSVYSSMFLLRMYAIMNKAHKNRLMPKPRLHYNINALSKKWCGFHDLGKADQCIHLVLGQEV